jgi:hypothetical protein
LTILFYNNIIRLANKLVTNLSKKAKIEDEYSFQCDGAEVVTGSGTIQAS